MDLGTRAPPRRLRPPLSARRRPPLLRPLHRTRRHAHQETPPKFKEVPLLFHDSRTDYPIGDGDTAGWNGFANLTLSGARLTIDYRDITNRRLYTETFTATPTGSVQLTTP